MRHSKMHGRATVKSLDPPSFVPTLEVAHRFRFIVPVGADGTQSITRKNLLNLVLVATSATTTVRLIQAIRLKRVSVWSNPIVGVGSSAESPLVTTSIEWLGENSPSTLISDTSMGVRPARVRSRPPPSASNRWWSISGFSETDVLFVLTYPGSSVVDVEVDIRLVEQEAPTAGDTPVGATLGQVYGSCLDGITTSALRPVGLTILP
jgi:hypothetical protein